MQTITLTQDGTTISRLLLELEEYRSRRDGSQAPKEQMDTICKIAVLERLLKDRRVNTRELSHEMARTYGDSFDSERFENACRVIVAHNSSPDLWS
jgi:hypothetical protein